MISSANDTTGRNDDDDIFLGTNKTTFSHVDVGWHRFCRDNVPDIDSRNVKVDHKVDRGVLTLASPRVCRGNDTSFLARGGKSVK